MNSLHFKNIENGQVVNLLKKKVIIVGFFSGEIISRELHVCYRLPRSRKKRIIKKWIKNQSNWRVCIDGCSVKD